MKVTQETWHKIETQTNNKAKTKKQPDFHKIQNTANELI